VEEPDDGDRKQQGDGQSADGEERRVEKDMISERIEKHLPVVRQGKCTGPPRQPLSEAHEKHSDDGNTDHEADDKGQCSDHELA